MPEQEFATTNPAFYSIVIPVYNDWVPLEHCLRSLAEVTNAPSFEVIVVDDGSKSAAPESIRQFEQSYPMISIRQPHAGVAAARNRGIKASKGSILLFVDADCRLEPNCLSVLHSAISGSPQHDCFQLELAGDCSGLVGRAEQLRLTTIQDHMVQENGCIRYLNTAGYAMRRESCNIHEDVFHPAALRCEDTLLLAGLMRDGALPLFVRDAVVQHAIPLSLVECFLKDVRSAYLEVSAADLIAAKGVKLRVGQRDRLRIMSSMWRTSLRKSIGRLAWFVVVARQMLRRSISAAVKFLGVRPALEFPGGQLPAIIACRMQAHSGTWGKDLS